MAGNLMTSFFTQYGKFYSPHPLKMNALFPFNEHAELLHIVDILSRKTNHHVLLETKFSTKIRPFFLETLVNYLSKEPIPKPLRHTELVYLDLDSLMISHAYDEHMEKEIRLLYEKLDNTNQYQLFALANLMPLTNKRTDNILLQRLLIQLLNHPKCRFLVFSNRKTTIPDYLTTHFDTISIGKLTDAEAYMIMKLERLTLEHFHHTVIPEDLFPYAYSLAKRYLSADDTLGNALRLLDSGAARISSNEKTEGQVPLLTKTMLECLLSDWNHIPASHLEPRWFKLDEFIQNMQQHIFGQDAAISLIGQELLESQTSLQTKTAPFCSLFFAGPKHSGKKTSTLVLVEQLFKQLDMLYFAQMGVSGECPLIDIKVENYVNKDYSALKAIINKKPYAVIMFEDIDKAPPTILKGLQEILSTGFLHDEEGQYNFRQAIIILSTTLGENRLNALAKTFVENNKDPINLMELIMS